MSSYWIDRIAVLLAVAFAVVWLGFRYRRNWRKKRDAPPGVGACGSTCDGCPYDKNCGGKPR